MISTALRPLEERAYANYWANPGSGFEGRNYTVERHKYRIAKNEEAKITKTPAWLVWSGKENIETIPVMKEGKTSILITGDSSRNKEMCLACGGFTTVKIELPQNWNKLMKELGYKPLEEFYLQTNMLPQQAKTYNFYKKNNRASFRMRSNSN